VNEDKPERETAELLGLIGQVDPPAAAALEDARRRLWSAVTFEMLSAGTASDAVLSAGTTSHAERDRARRRRQSQQIARRHRTDPGS
jgi:hypothetical protein